MNADGLPEVGRMIGGRYRIDRVIGRGGMGVVYAATDMELELNMPVAIKWLLPECLHEPTAVERFLQEARCAAAIRHPNVVTIFGIGSAGAPYIVMELLQGQSLAQALVNPATGGGRSLMPRELGPLILPALRGVQAAHETQLHSTSRGNASGGLAQSRGIVHRDLKPDNIFLAEQGGDIVPKVLDFGIAKPADRIGQASTLTGDGAFLGTPAYMAPEQLFSPDRIGPWTDVYAIGVILYEILAGEPPFMGTTPIDVAMKVGQGHYEPLRARNDRVSPQLEQIIARAMAREIDDRYSDVKSLEKDLRACLDSEPTQATSTSNSARPRTPPLAATNTGSATDNRTPQPREITLDPAMAPRQSRRGATLGMAGLIVLALAGIAWGVWHSGQDPQRATSDEPMGTPSAAAQSTEGSTVEPPSRGEVRANVDDRPVVADGWEQVASNEADAGTAQEPSVAEPTKMPSAYPAANPRQPVVPVKVDRVQRNQRPPSTARARRHSRENTAPATREAPKPAGSESAVKRSHRAGRLQADEF